MSRKSLKTELRERIATIREQERKLAVLEERLQNNRIESTKFQTQLEELQKEIQKLRVQLKRKEEQIEMSWQREQEQNQQLLNKEEEQLRIHSELMEGEREIARLSRILEDKEVELKELRNQRFWTKIRNVF